MTEKQKRDAGYLYNTEDREIVSELIKCGDLCHEFNQLKSSDMEAQEALLRRLLGGMGQNVLIRPPFWCDYGYHITVGDAFFANHNCQILDGGEVTFGDHVYIGPNCVFTTAEHPVDPDQRRAGLEAALPIKVGNNVWFGAGVIVLGGVTIGDDAVIAAGSVVTKDIPARTVAAGVPCRVLRQVNEKDKEKYPKWEEA